MVAAQKSPLITLARILAAIGGFALSRYRGPQVWLPNIVVILLGFLFIKTPVRPKAFAGVIAVTLGHLVWFAAISLVTGDWLASRADQIALFAGVLWLWVRPGLSGALFLGLVQTTSLAINAADLLSFPPGSSNHRTLTAHCALRLLALVCLVVGERRRRRAAGGSARLRPVP